MRLGGALGWWGQCKGPGIHPLPLSSIPFTSSNVVQRPELQWLCGALNSPVQLCIGSRRSRPKEKYKRVRLQRRRGTAGMKEEKRWTGPAILSPANEVIDLRWRLIVNKVPWLRK